MKRVLLAVVLQVLIFGGVQARQETTTTQDAKDAGSHTKQAAKKTGSATKKGTKKVVNKTAQKTDEGAKKLEDKTKP